MVKSFSELRKKSKKTNFKELKQKLEKGAGKTNYKDERFWQPTKDKAGNGQAIIRFLPEPKGEDVFFIKMFNYGFKDKGGWFIENCPTTIGEPSPVLEHTSDLWDSGDDEKIKIARQRKRRTGYISNIYVVSDPGNPENEGKVFLYKYGQKIFDKIQEKLVPEFEGEESVNVFDFWEGANFKLRIKKVEGWSNYDSSVFDNPSPLFEDEDDERYQKVWNKQYSLQQFLDPENFKSYDELKKRYYRVIGKTLDNKNIKSKTLEEKVEETEDISIDLDEINNDIDLDDIDLDESIKEYEGLVA